MIASYKYKRYNNLLAKPSSETAQLNIPKLVGVVGKTRIFHFQELHMFPVNSLVIISCVA